MTNNSRQMVGKIPVRDSGNLESEKNPPMIPVTIFKIYGSFLKTKFYLELVEKISFYLIMSIWFIPLTDYELFWFFMLIRLIIVISSLWFISFFS